MRLSFFFRQTLLFFACWLTALSTVAQDGSVRSISRDKHGLPRNIVFNRSAEISAAHPRELLKQYLPLSENSEMILKYDAHPDPGVEVQKYQQWYRGYEVVHGVFSIISKEGIVAYMSGRIYPEPEAGAAEIRLTEQEAFTAALAKVAAEKYRWQTESTMPPAGSLVWVEDFTGDVPDGKLYLAWSFDIYAVKPISRSQVFVDAQTGKILFVNSILEPVAGSGLSLYSGTVNMNVKKVSATSYRLEDTVRGGGIVTQSNDYTDGTTIIEVTSPTTVFASSVAVDAHWGAEMVYDYWLNKHGRYSVDDADMLLQNYVHYQPDITGYNNAFWDGSSMHYGDGTGPAAGGFDPMGALDVCGHEIGHGVCQFTAGLIYDGESGAINEGLSDIWGAMVEHYADPSESDLVPKEVWSVGEEVGAGTALRYMNNPQLAGNPDTYNGTYWVAAGPGCTGYDHCGVHNNSGVTNYWCYLTVAGGSGTNDNGDNYIVSGLGFDTAADIIYLAELSMDPSSNYVDFRDATVMAAGILYGDCSHAQHVVDSAWYAVGIGDGFLPCICMITFNSGDTSVTEDAVSSTCNGSHLVNIPIRVKGLAPAGGNPIATVTLAGGSAVAGVDFDFTGPAVLTFPAGSLATQYVPVTIYDNGAVQADKNIIFDISINAAGSDASVTPIYSSYTLNIASNDLAPDTGRMILYEAGIPNGAQCNLSSAFRSDKKMARSQFLITSDYLTLSGLSPSKPIMNLAFRVIVKNSTQPFTGYTVKIKNTTLDDATYGWETGMTQVYNGNYTTDIGWNTIPFTAPFSWDGFSNLVVQVCFTNASAGSSNDKLEGMSPVYNATYWTSSAVAADGCSLPEDSAVLSSAVPVMRFGQLVPTPVESTLGSSRNWNVKAGEQVYFYSSDGEVIAGIEAATADLGCVNATLSGSGNGFTSLTGVPAINRSRKEFTLTPSGSTTGTNYDAVVYFKITELAGADLSNVRLLKTNAATDAGINASNTVLTIPSITAGSVWSSFTGSFTGFSRFFLVNNDFPLAVSQVTGNDPFIRITTNPFTNAIGLTYQVGAPTNVSLRLMDIAGRLLHEENRTWDPGQNEITMEVGGLNLAPGSYLLQIVTPTGNTTSRLTKQ